MIVGQDITSGNSKIVLGEEDASDKSGCITYNRTNNTIDLRISGASDPNGLYVKSDGSTGIGTTDPKGLLQLKNSYVVAPAPTGTAATDTQNINDAITAVSSGGYAGTVCLQAGTYVINDTITLPSSLKLIGSGFDKTIIQMNKADGGVPVLDAANTVGVVIRELQVTAVQTTTHLGINFKRTHFNIIENVHISNMDIGIYVSWDFSQIRNFYMHNCNIAIKLGDPNDTTNEWCSATVLIGGQISSFNYYGLQCAFAHNIWIYSVTFELSRGPNCVAALSLEKHDGGFCGSHLVNGCYFEDNDGDQIRIDSVGNKLIGNWICYEPNMVGPVWAFSGTGQYPNDLTPSGTYTGTYTRTYMVKITTTGGADMFRYSDDWGSTWSSEISITGAAQALSNGVYITFAHTTGHTLNDCWSFNAFKAQNGINWVSGSGAADGNSLQGNLVTSWGDGPLYNDVLLRNLGIGTTAPDAKLEVNGFTKLGSDAPKIKIKKYTGTMDNDSATHFAHGLTRSKIISSSIQIESSVPDWQFPGNAYSNKGYHWYIDNTNVEITDVGSDLQGRTYIVVLTYEE